MSQIAGLRGVLPEPSKLREVIAAPDAIKERLASGAVVRDPGRALYRYHQLFQHSGRTVTRKALIAAVRLAPWAEGSIRRHEATDAALRDAELARIRANAGHAAPVLAGFRDAAGEVDRQFRTLDGERPTLELTTADGTIHRLFRSQSAEIVGAIRHAFAPKRIYILDDAARYEAMVAYQDELAAAHPVAMYSSANYGLLCLVNLDDPALVVAARHRIVRGANLDAAAILAAARPWFIVERLAGAARDVAQQQAALADTLAHQPAFIAVFAGDDAWKLTLSPEVSPAAAGVQAGRAVQKLDPIVVDHLFAPRVVPGAQLANATDAQVALAAVAAGADAALILRPVATEQLIHVADLGELLPAGSTGFAPPIAAGLVASVIDPDEDLV